jgi:hypothetical protein
VRPYAGGPSRNNNEKIILHPIFSKLMKTVRRSQLLLMGDDSLFRPQYNRSLF